MLHAVFRRQDQGIHHVASFQVVEVLNRCVTLVRIGRLVDSVKKNLDPASTADGQSKQKTDYSVLTPVWMHFFEDSAEK